MTFAHSAQVVELDREVKRLRSQVEYRDRQIEQLKRRDVIHLTKHSDDYERTGQALQVLMHCLNYTTDDDLREVLEKAHSEIDFWHDNYDPTPYEAEYK